MNCRCCLAWTMLLSWHGLALPGVAGNFTSGTEQAVKFGVHEIVLTGDGSVANPFDTPITVTFTSPSGAAQSKTVQGFYDGDNTWRARVYVSEAGSWKWSSQSATDSKLNGQSGQFQAGDSQLRGRLLNHPRNPRQWITEDGQWFLNLNDTAYFALCTHDAEGQPVSEADFQAYIKDDVDKGITSIRCFLASGEDHFNKKDGSDYHRWRQIFADDALSRYRLDNLQTVDRRLAWLLEKYPDIYVQLILFPLGDYATDDIYWKKLTGMQKEGVLRHLVARYAAFPQLFWLLVNDAHYGEKYPDNNAFVREAGAYVHKHDRWSHPLSTGHARKVPFALGEDKWVTYIHLEDEADLAASKYALYHHLAKPVFLGEDRYEQDHGITARDPLHMQYFQRRLYWAWLLAGGSTNYGGRWGIVTPYTQTGVRSWRPEFRPVTFNTQLVGLDSVRAIRDYFVDRKIDLGYFEPAHALAKDADSSSTLPQAIKVMRRGDDEILIYHPNAAAEGKQADVDHERTASLEIDLRGISGEFAVEWYRADDGTAQPGKAVHGGDWRTLIAPWKGQDCVVRLLRNSK